MTPTDKTAEQFVIERCRLVMDLDGTDIVLDSISSVARMAEAYAAQERDKVRNQAISDCQRKLAELYPYAAKLLESLKTII